MAVEIPGITALARIDGAVFRGQGSGGRGIAVKMLPTPFDRGSRAQFDAERVRLARLRHVPAILQIDDVGALPDGRPYLVGELCTESLADRGRLPEPQVVSLGRELAEALALAHELDVVHGGITPRNVLFRRSGVPALSDFGVALRQSFLGEPTEFVAPETLHDGTLTKRADLYGLGATLYFALTGEPPFPARIGEHPSERILRVISRPAPAVPAAPELAGLLAQLLATRPEDRPGDAGVVADRFAAMAAQSPVVEETQPSADPPPAQVETSTDWSGLLDDVLYDVPPAVQTEPAPVADPPVRQRFSRLTWALAGGLVLVVALFIVIGRMAGGPAAQSARPPSPSPSTVDSAVPVPSVRLVSARDLGSTVELTWNGAADLNYAVVIAEPGQTAEVVLAHHARKFRVAVTPGRQYCFLVQATDGKHVVETDPRPIRGAVCHTS